MVYTQAELLKLIHDTKAVSIWNRNKGPVFWYAASVPGPFYVNTEFVVGADSAADLLEKITNILASTQDLADRSHQIHDLIMAAYDKDPSYRHVIETLVERVKTAFPADAFSLISGGERRDWLFSIPFAKLYGMKHAYIFKNHEIYCEEGLAPNEATLHVADLINNAASYFDAWFPALKEANLRCAGTACINTRGSNGLNRLQEVGQKVVALNNIDVTFFEQSFANHLIDEGTLEEIRIYFKSSQEWASTYLLNNESHIALFDVPHLDGKSRERLTTFFSKDPWELKASHETFFAAMLKTAQENT